MLSKFSIFTVPRYNFLYSSGALTVTLILTGGLSGLRFDPDDIEKVQVPQSGHSAIFQFSFESADPLFLIAKLPVIVPPG